MAEPRQAKKSVAVVGSGMAGLVTAYLLQQDSLARYDVQIFETQDRLSLDSASYSVSAVDEQKSQPCRIDIPMRALDDGFHVNLKCMYDFLGVGYMSQKFIYSLSKFSADDGRKHPYFLHSSSNHRIPPLRLQGEGFLKWVMQIIYLAVCYFWFTVCCFLVKPRAASTSGEDETLRSYLKRIRLSTQFIKDYLLPLMSSVTTCPHEALLDFPAIDATEYARKTYRQPHYTVIGGVQDVQARLAKDIVVNLRATVNSVSNVGNKTRLTWTDANDQHNLSDFDHVIMAVTPNVVGTLYEPLREMMDIIPVISGESVVHHDASAIVDSSELLDQLSANAQKGRKEAQIMHINSDTLSTESTHQKSSVFVTNFPISQISPDKVVHRARLMRVLRTPKSRKIVNTIFASEQSEQTLSDKDQIIWHNGNDNVWLVGSWCWDGMVLLEGCVVSAMRVAAALGVEIPWKIKH